MQSLHFQQWFLKTPKKKFNLVYRLSVIVQNLCIRSIYSFRYLKNDVIFYEFTGDLVP